MKKIVLIVLFGGLCLFIDPRQAYSDTEMFLYLTNIKGDIIAMGYAEWIEIIDWSWQVSNPDAGAAPGGVTSRPIIRPLLVHKPIDKASPLISLYALNGESILEAILVSRIASQDPHEFLRITMESVQIANVSSSCEIVAGATESVALTFSKICYEQTPIDDTGAPGASIQRCWDITNNVES